MGGQCRRGDIDEVLCGRWAVRKGWNCEGRLRESQQLAKGGNEVEAGHVDFAWLLWSQVDTCALLIKQSA